MSCECEVGIAVEAAKDGVFLSPGVSFDWIGTRGPYGLPPASKALDPVVSIAVALGADLDALRLAKRVSRPRSDLMHADSRVIIEVDEIQHFTSHRVASFDHYPPETPLGFDIEEYRSLCGLHSCCADGAFAHRAAVGFGPRGRGKQRALYDALRDLSLPAAGWPSVVRIPVPDRDYVRAWKQARSRVFAAVAAAT